MDKSMRENLINGLSFLAGILFCNLLWMVYYGVAPTYVASSAFGLLLVGSMFAIHKHIELQGRQ